MRLALLVLLVACVEDEPPRPAAGRPGVWEQNGEYFVVVDGRNESCGWNATCGVAAMNNSPRLYARCARIRAACRGEPPPTIETTHTRCKQTRNGEVACESVTY